MTHRLRILAVLCLLFAFSGCRDADVPEEVNAFPFEGIELSIAVPDGYDFKTRWQIELDEWSARTGAKYSLNEYPLVENQTSSPTHSAENDQPVLLLLPITDVASRRFAPFSGDMLAPENLHNADLFEGLRTGPASIGGKPALLPVSSPVLTYYYRRDLFDELKLTPPETWEAHRKLVESLSGKDLAVVAPWNQQFRATMFLSRAVSFAKHPHQYSLFFDVETCEPLIDGPGFVRALEEARHDVELMKQRVDVSTLSPADCRRMLLEGDAAVAITYEIPTAADEINRPDAAVIGCVRLPGHPQAYNRATAAWETLRDEPVNRCTLTAFTGFCAGVSADATERQQRAAWEFLAQIAVDTSQLLRVFPSAARSLCRESQLNQPTVWVGSEMSAGESREIVKAAAASLRDPRLVAELPVAGRQRYRESLAQGIGRCLTGKATADESLSQVADEWREITEDIGPRNVLNSYRRSIGLSERRKR